VELLFLVSWKIRVHGRVLRLGRVWRKLGRGFLRGGLEAVEERNICCGKVVCSNNKYRFDDGGGIIIQVKKSRVLREGPIFFLYRAYRSLVKPLRAEDTSMP